MPVARPDLRGFPSIHRLLLPPSRKVAGARPSWASLLSRTGRHRCRSRSISPGRDHRPPLLGFVGGWTPVPFHRPHPRRSPSRGVATASDPSCTLESRSDLVVSHDLAGFLRRSPGLSPGFPSPFKVMEDSRACCIPMPIVGFDAFLSPRPVAPAPGAASSLTPFLLVTRTGCFPASKFRTPRRVPLPRSRDASPRSLPPRTFRVSRSATLLDGAVAGSAIPVVSRGRRPSRPCSAVESVPPSAVFERPVAYPPWALFPFEVAFDRGCTPLQPCPSHLGHPRSIVDG